MQPYRIYRIEYTGRRRVPVDINAFDDRQALQVAQELREDSLAVEVWNGTRMIDQRWPSRFGET